MTRGVSWRRFDGIFTVITIDFILVEGDSLGWDENNVKRLVPSLLNMVRTIQTQETHSLASPKVGAQITTGSESYQIQIVLQKFS